LCVDASTDKVCAYVYVFHLTVAKITTSLICERVCRIGEMILTGVHHSAVLGGK